MDTPTPKAYEHKATLDLVMLCARGMPEVPRLQAVLDTVQTADTIGPLFFPSEWHHQGGRENLAWQRKMIEAALTFRKAFDQVVASDPQAQAIIDADMCDRSSCPDDGKD